MATILGVFFIHKFSFRNLKRWNIISQRIEMLIIHILIYFKYKQYFSANIHHMCHFYLVRSGICKYASLKYLELNFADGSPNELTGV